MSTTSAIANHAETIFALSSGSPPAGVAIIRISGSEAKNTMLALAGREIESKRATLVRLRDRSNDLVLDQSIILWFPGPETTTGEDLLELHCHGGRAVIRALEHALEQLPGLRRARPGEFTRRALQNGRIDLGQAEGLADLLSAETETQRRAALAMSAGYFSRDINHWRQEILGLSAMVEGALDFSDEDDIPTEGIEIDVMSRLTALNQKVTAILAQPSAERLRNGIRVVLAGPPNVGKSTLLNRLVGRDAAIISDVAGTTRDRIEVPVAIDGVAFVFTDTAGLKDDGFDPVEAIGIERARDAIADADILLWLGDADTAPPDAILVETMIDKAGGRSPSPAGTLRLSALTGEGISSLISQLLKLARELLPGESDYALSQRQRSEVAALAKALDQATTETDMLILAEELRAGRAAIDRLTGRASTEDMLDALFDNFCIGK